jgi:hypothetical protein
MMSGLLERLLQRARQEFPAMLSRLTADPPDAVCYDAMTLAGKLAAMKLAAPDIALIPSYATNEYFSVRELMPARPPDRRLRSRAGPGPFSVNGGAAGLVEHLLHPAGIPARGGDL